MEHGPESFVTAQAPPPLAPGSVHLWRFDLALTESRADALRALLTDEEAQRAERFRFAEHRRRFIVRRARLRSLVAAYQGLAASDVRFDYGAKGKPQLPPDLDRHREGPLAFNLSDSKDLAVVAVTRGTALGVDVEVLRDMPDALSISKSFFAVAERHVLAAVPEAQRAQTFFNCWTRKEAYIKATGDGLSAPLDQFTVTLHPDSPCCFEEIEGDAQRARGWSLIAFRPLADAVGAVASERTDLQISGCFAWPDDGA